MYKLGGSTENIPIHLLQNNVMRKTFQTSTAVYNILSIFLSTYSFKYIIYKK